MSASIRSEINHIASPGLFERMSDYIKKTIFSRRFEYTEIKLVLLVGALLPFLSTQMREVAENLFFSKDLSTKPINMMLITGVISVSALNSGYCYQKYLKSPLVARKVKKIVTESMTRNLEKKALLLNTSYDWIGALSTRSFLSTLQNLTKTHSIQMIAVSTQEQLKQALSSIGDKMDIVWIRGHGSAKNITLGDRLELTENSKSTMKQIGNLLVNEGTVILQACNAGKGSRNIARVFSENCPHVTVYATSEPVDGIDELELEDASRPVFYAGECRKESTRIYKAGHLKNVASKKD